MKDDDVTRALNRLALLYQSFAETLDRELGREAAAPLIKKAIGYYGDIIGKRARERTLARGLPLAPENFSDDLPTTGWKSSVEEVNGETVTRLEGCPLAAAWSDMDPALAKIYCHVDQAKTEGYNPEYTCVHVANKLDGDPFCRLAVRKK